MIKLIAFDPDRPQRRKFYQEVIDSFPEYNVFVGGSSSFDMAPKLYNKYYALDKYCSEKEISHDEVVFVGDDYGKVADGVIEFQNKIKMYDKQDIVFVVKNGMR